MEERRRQAEQAGRAAQAVKLDRQTIRDGIRSDPWRHFIETAKPQDNNVWPVATITPDKLEKMGLPANARVVRLQSKNVVKKSHRKRYQSWTEHDWAFVQKIIDEGLAIPSGQFKGDIQYFDEQTGQAWLVVLSHEVGSKNIILKTAHRLIQ